MSNPGPPSDDFDPTHPSVWLIPKPLRQALVLAGMVKLAPIHHLWLEQRLSSQEPDRSLGGWSVLPLGIIATIISFGQRPVPLILAVAIAVTFSLIPPQPWTDHRRRQILRDHGLRDPRSTHTRFAPEDFPLVRLAEIAGVAGAIILLR